jgi:hypothetical protein
MNHNSPISARINPGLIKMMTLLIRGEVGEHPRYAPISMKAA